MAAVVHVTDSGNKEKPVCDGCSVQSTVTDIAYLSKVINGFISGEKVELARAAVMQQAREHQYYHRQDLIQALTSLQLEYRPVYKPQQTVHVNTDEFKSCLLNSVAKLNKVAIPKSMDQIDGRTIDFVEMIFGVFMRDPDISDVVKTLLLSMQVPIIKISLLDQKFFFDVKHPARNILNSIASIGIGIEHQDNTVYQTMAFIVEQLLRGFDKNISSFSTAQTALNRLSAIERCRNGATEKQTRKMILHEHARQLVLTELQYYTAGIELPVQVQPLVLQHWSTLMFHRYLKHGRDSIEWGEVAGVLRLLMRSLQPIEVRDDWLALKKIHKGIVNIITNCLHNTRQNKEKIFMATKNLDRYYARILSESEFYSCDQSDGDSSDDVEFVALSDEQRIGKEKNPLDQQVELSKIRLACLPREVRQDAWFEVFTGSSHPIRRLKLSVIIKEKARLVFVDRKGLKVITKDAEIFLSELEKKQSRIIEDGAIFDRALSRVVREISRE